LLVDAVAVEATADVLIASTAVDEYGLMDVLTAFVWSVVIEPMEVAMFVLTGFTLVLATCVGVVELDAAVRVMTTGLWLTDEGRTDKVTLPQTSGALAALLLMAPAVGVMTIGLESVNEGKLDNVTLPQTLGSLAWLLLTAPAVGVMTIGLEPVNEGRFDNVTLPQTLGALAALLLAAPAVGVMTIGLESVNDGRVDKVMLPQTSGWLALLLTAAAEVAIGAALLAFDMATQISQCRPQACSIAY